jgi:O-antigen/teichoic acid export membrane protein
MHYQMAEAIRTDRSRAKDREPSLKLSSLKRRLLSGGAWALCSKTMTALVFLAIDALLARFLTPEDLGIYYLAFSIVVVSTALAELGLGRAAVRLLGENFGLYEPRRVWHIIRTVLLLGLVGASSTAIIYFFLGGALAKYAFNVPGLAAVTGLMAGWMITITLKRILTEIFRGLHDIRLASIFGISAEGLISGSFLLLGLGILFWMKEVTLNMVILLIVISGLCSIFIAGWALYRKMKHLPRLGAESDDPMNRLGVGDIVRLALPMLVISMANLALTTQADVWILGMFRPQGDLAIYGAAARLMMLISIPLMMVNSVVPPIIAELNAQGKKNNLERMLRTTATVAGLPSLLMLVGLIFCAGSILSLIYGEYYKGGAMVLALLGLGQVVNVWAGSCGLTLMMAGHQSTMMWISILLSGISIGVGILAASHFGIVGMAMVSAGRLICQNLLMLVFARKRVGVWTHAYLAPAQLVRLIKSVAHATKMF